MEDYKHSVIKRVGDNLFYERNQFEKPKFPTGHSIPELGNYHKKIKDFESSLETFEVHESQKERFIETAAKKYFAPPFNWPPTVLFEELKARGISIPSEMVEIRRYKMMDGIALDPPKNFAFLKEDKEETNFAEKFKNVHLNKNSQWDWEEVESLIKADMIETAKKRFNLIRK